MDFFFNIINNAAVPWALAFSIVILAIIIWIRFRLSLRYCHQHLHSAQNLLNNAPPAEFISFYEEISEKFSANPLLAHQWESFKQSLILPRSPIQPIFYTYRPQHYFNESTLIAPRINLRLYQAVPNILVGIGLFFTFIGLVAALWFASEGVAAPDIEKAQQALRDLLHAATFKFVTSIAGLLASLVFSWREKSHLYQLQYRLDIFCQSLEQRLNYATLEQLSYQQVQEAQRQTEQLSRFNSDFAVSIASALEDKFSEKMAQAMQPLAISISNLADKLTQTNQNALETMLESFSRQLQGAAGEEMRQVAQALSGLIPTLHELRNSFDASGSDFGERMTDAAQIMQRSVDETMSMLLEKLATTNAAMQEKTGEEMQRLSVPIQQLIEATGHLTVSLEESSASIRGRLTSAAQEAAYTLTTASDGLGERLTVAGQQFVTALGETAGQLQETRTHFDELLREGAEVLSKSFKQLEAIQVSLQVTHGQLVAATQPLAESAQAMRAAGGEVTGLVDAVAHTTQQLAQTSATVEQVWKKYQAHFEDVDEDISKVFSELGTGLENYRRQVEIFTKSLDDSLNTAVKSLSSLITELVEAIEDMHAKRGK